MTNKTPPSIGLKELGLPNRVYEGLIGFGFSTLEDVKNCLDVTWIRFMPGVGPKQCDETIRVLRRYDIELPLRRYRTYVGLTVQVCNRLKDGMDYIPPKTDSMTDLFRLQVADINKAFETGCDPKAKDLKILRYLIDQVLSRRGSSSKPEESEKEMSV